MGLFEHFPYTNFHELNLNWILQRLKELLEKTEKMQQEIDDLQEGETTESTDLPGFSGSIDAGTLSRIYDVVLSYYRHNNDLVYMHKCSALFDYHEGLQSDGHWYGNSPLMYPLPVTYGKCGFDSIPYTDAQGNDREGYAINCTTLAILVMLGIPYEYTTYTSNVQNTLEQVGAAGYAFNMWQELLTFKNADDYYNSQRFYQRMKELGLARKTDNSLRDIKPGNILWVSKSGKESGINHCAICLYVSPLTVQRSSGLPQYLIAEVRNSPYPVTLRWLTADDMLEDGWLFTAQPYYGPMLPETGEVLYKMSTGTNSVQISGLDILNGEILTFDFDYTPATETDYINCYVNGDHAKDPGRLMYITRPQNANAVGQKKHFTIPMPMLSAAGATCDPNITIESITLICHGESSANNASIENLTIYRGMPSDLTERPKILLVTSQSDYEQQVAALIPETNKPAAYDIPIILAPASQITIGGVDWAATQYPGTVHVNNSGTAKRCTVSISGYSNDLKSKWNGSAWTHTASEN